MPKGGKRSGRGVALADFWDAEYASQTSTTPALRQRAYRPAPSRPAVDPQALKRAYMLQHFQLILRSDVLSAKANSDAALPQGQRRLVECLQSSDSMVPWASVYAVVMRAELEMFECPICLDTPVAPRITECGHVFCMSCMLHYLHERRRADQPRTCPVCHGLVGLYMLRPCVLRLIRPLERTTAEEVRFDLFRRHAASCILHRYDDPRLPASAVPEAAPAGAAHSGQPRAAAAGDGQRAKDDALSALPHYDESCAVQSRYVLSTPEFESSQRCLDGAGISERLHEVEQMARPLAEFDAMEEQCLLEALNEVTKELEKLPAPASSSMSKDSPPIAPRPLAGGAHAASASRVYELYAEGDGQPFYLHMVTVKMLKHDAQLRQAPLPDSITGKVIDLVSFTQDEESRRIYKVFSHVPLHGLIQLCLLDLSATVLPETMQAFQHTLDDLAKRRNERRRAEAAADANADASWHSYLERYTQHAYDSPAILPSDVSLDTGMGGGRGGEGANDTGASFLQLPSAGSTSSDHGLPPNTLDTRQRATKRQDPNSADALAEEVAAASPARLASSPFTRAALLTQVADTRNVESYLDATAASALPAVDHAGANGTATTSTPLSHAPPGECLSAMAGAGSNNGSVSSSGRWGGGSAAKLFRSSPASGGGVSATWGGHTFTPSASSATPAPPTSVSAGQGTGAHGPAKTGAREPQKPTGPRKR